MAFTLLLDGNKQIEVHDGRVVVSDLDNGDKPHDTWLYMNRAEMMGLAAALKEHAPKKKGH